MGWGFLQHGLARQGGGRGGGAGARNTVDSKGFWEYDLYDLLPWARRLGQEHTLVSV